MTAGPLPRFPTRPDDCVIRRVRDEWGWMSNMSPHPLNFDGLAYRTSEHLFQALRFPPGHPARSVVRAEPSPMSAKMVAHRLRLQAERGGLRSLVAPRSDADWRLMRGVLLLKLAAHPRLAAQLAETGQRQIVEDCTRRPTESGLFWGARLVGATVGTGEPGRWEWEGRNELGRAWAELRAHVQATGTTSALTGMALAWLRQAGR